MFSVGGYNNWKSFLKSNKGISKHISGWNNIHNKARQQIKLLLHKKGHITNVFEQMDASAKHIKTICLRVHAQIARHLAFRGHDESVNLVNGGNFLETVDQVLQEEPELAKLLSNAPKNATYRCGGIQKNYCQATSALVQRHIRGEIGDGVPYTILLDEARCVA